MSQRLRKVDGRLNPALFDCRYWRGGEGDEGSGAGTGEPPEGTSGAGGAPGGDGGNDPQAKPEGTTPETVSKADYDAALERMKAADRATQAALAKVKEYEDKDKSELQRAQDEATAVKAENDQLKATLKQQRIANEFFASNKHTWHKPQRALQLLDLGGVTVEDDGTVKGLEAAIDKLVKSDPYLVKTDEPGDQQDPSGDGKDGKGSKSGKLDRAALEKKYPALRR